MTTNAAKKIHKAKTYKKEKSKRTKRCSYCNKPGHQWHTCTTGAEKALDAIVNEMVAGSTCKNRMWAIRPRHNGKLISLDVMKIALRVLQECTLDQETARGNKISSNNPFARAQRYTGISIKKLRQLNSECERIIRGKAATKQAPTRTRTQTQSHSQSQIQPHSQSQIQPQFQQESQSHSPPQSQSLTQILTTMQAQNPIRRGKYEREKHWSRHWIAGIREVVTALNFRGKPVTIRAIQAGMDLERQYSLKMTNSTLRRVLLEIGYKYDNAFKAARNFIETKRIKDLRMDYLQERARIRKDEPDTIEIWLDESYCNQYHVARSSWYTKNETVKRGTGKGKRWIIAHAGGSCGWVGEPMVYPAAKDKNKKKAKSGGGNGGSTSNTVTAATTAASASVFDDNDDYHESMNADAFKQYFEKLCRWMKNNYPGRKVIFHMDNAPYHTKIEGLRVGKRSLSSSSKAVIIKWLKDRGATDEELCLIPRKPGDDDKPMESSMTWIELYLLTRNPKVRGKPIPEAIVERYEGYSILWIPPYHPTLNPIEEAWGITKGFVAYENDGSSFDAVRLLIDGGFKKVTPEVWKKLVDRTYATEDRMITDHRVAVITSDDINKMIIEDYDNNSNGNGSGDDNMQIDEENVQMHVQEVHGQMLQEHTGVEGTRTDYENAMDVDANMEEDGGGASGGYDGDKSDTTVTEDWRSTKSESCQSTESEDWKDIAKIRKEKGKMKKREDYIGDEYDDYDEDEDDSDEDNDDDDGDGHLGLIKYSDIFEDYVTREELGMIGIENDDDNEQ
jgi:hypothetical protein